MSAGIEQGIADKSTRVDESQSSNHCSVGRALRRCCHCIGAVITSSLCLAIVFVAYAIAGAFLFQVGLLA